MVPGEKCVVGTSNVVPRMGQRSTIAYPKSIFLLGDKLWRCHTDYSRSAQSVSSSR
jgi:hypothetical protein